MLPDVEAAEKTVVLGIPMPNGYSYIRYVVSPPYFGPGAVDAIIAVPSLSPRKLV